MIRATPTHVGNGWSAAWNELRLTGHPHTRGERASDRLPPRQWGGPPPHTWGTAVGGLAVDQLGRATPTHVGNGASGLHQLSRPAGHPHTRGERPKRSNAFFQSVGPPPHTWGTVLLMVDLDAHFRATPTHVGNGVPAATSGPRSAGHPHTRGERAGWMVQGFLSCGPPPHTWGTGHCRALRGPANRATPTHVGNGPRRSAARTTTTGHPHTRGERTAGTRQKTFFAPRQVSSWIVMLPGEPRAVCMP